MMSRVAPALAVACMLAGCATPHRPEPALQVQRVEVPVPVPCVEVRPRRPATPVESLRPDAALGDMVKALLAERRLRAAYERELEAALTACSGISSE